ncbi:A-kinase anchor protein 4, partial [Ophiophagus hannah]
MANLPHKECPNTEYMVPVTMMSPDIDWMHCPTGLCKVSLFDDKVPTDKQRKLVCFVDVSSLKNQELAASGQLGDIEAPDPGIDLGEREIVVIRDEKKSLSNTEGAVCFFKQSPCEKGDVTSWLNRDLQKYAVGFQHALNPTKGPGKSSLCEAEQ